MNLVIKHSVDSKCNGICDDLSVISDVVSDDARLGRHLRVDWELPYGFSAGDLNFASVYQNTTGKYLFIKIIHDG